MAKSTIDKKENIEEKLEYLGLDLENIPKQLKDFEPLKFRIPKTYEEKQYKQYRYVPVKEIEILLSPTTRLDDLEEKEDFSKPKTVTRYVVETTETVEESTSEVSNENVESNGEKSNYPQKVEKKGGFFEKIRNFFFKSKHKNT